MPDWEEWERRQRERLDHLEQVGVVEHVGTTITVDEHEVEIVATYADCVETAVLYRAPREAMLHPDIFWPPEAARGGGSGGLMGDLQVSTFAAVQPHRKSIGLTFRPRGSSRFDDEGAHITIPINRAATARYDRHLAEAIEPIEQDGLAISILDANVGMLSAAIDVSVEAVDPAVLGFEFEWPHGHRRHAWGPGPAVLWQDWFPEPESPGNTVRRRVSSTMESVQTSLGFESGARITARRSPRGMPPMPPPPKEPRMERHRPIAARELPTGTPLRLAGASGGSGPPGATHGLMTFRFDAPSREAAHVEVELTSTYVHRFGGGEIVALPPPPSDERRVEIGATVDIDGGTVEFVAWEPDPYNPGTQLVVRMPSPDWYPDLRVIVGEASLSFMAHPGHEGTVRCMLMRRDARVLNRREGIPVALRMVGRPITPPRFIVPLTAA